MQVSGFRIYFLEPGYFFSKILSEFRKKIVALQTFIRKSTINSCTCISIKKNVLHYQFQSYIHDEENLASTEARFFYAQNQEVNTK